MKITTQRTLIWVGNFALVFVMLGILGVMAIQRQKPAARTELQEIARSLEDALKKVKPPEVDGGPKRDETAGIPSVSLNDFAGYIPPPPPASRPVGTPGVAQAPDLATLIEVVFVVAPLVSEKSGGPAPADSSGCLVRVKSKPADTPSMFYRIGDIIGIGQADTNGDKKVRVDDDPKLKEFGGAKVVGLQGDGIICEWAKKPVLVRVVFGEPTGGELVSTNGTRIGKIAGAAGGAATAAAGEVDLGTFTPGQGEGNVIDKFEINETGMKALSERGDQIMEGATFETVDLGATGAKEGDDGAPATRDQGLKIRSLPRELVDRGLKEGDVIISVDDRKVASKEAVVNYVKQTYRTKQQYRVTYLRDGATRIVDVAVPKGTRELQNAGRRFGINK